VGGLATLYSSGLLRRLGILAICACCIGAGIVLELRVDAETPDPLVEGLELFSGLVPELPEGSPEYPGLEEYILGSGEIPVFGDIKGV